MKNNFIICVTGKSGVGKTMFSKMLSVRLNFFHVDIDKIGHKIYEDPKVVEEVEKIFNQRFRDSSGNFDRKKLGFALFSSKNPLTVKRFNNFTKIQIQKFVDKELEMHQNVVLDWVLLPKTKYWNMSDYKILIRPQKDEQRFIYLKNREGLSEEYLKLRDNAGMEYDLEKFDFVITNGYLEQDIEENLNKVEQNINTKRGER